MDFKKLADAFEEIGIREAKLALSNRGKLRSDAGDTDLREVVNRQLLAGNLCIHAAEAIRAAIRPERKPRRA